jgi:hypothetical protein
MQSGGPLVGKVREWYVASRHLQGCSPCLCRLRTEWLVPASKYWTYRSQAGDMSPISLVACHKKKLGLSLLLHWFDGERNWVWTCGSVSRCAVDCVGSPFSREQWDLSKFVDDSWKVAMHWLREIRMVWDHTRTERGMRVACWSSFPLQGVHRFESSW